MRLLEKVVVDGKQVGGDGKGGSTVIYWTGALKRGTSD